jgi:GxxExxY protein
MNENEIITIILDEAFHIHRSLGPGMLESVYKKCLAYRLRTRGLLVEEEKPIPVYFEEIKMDCGYRADLIVERKVVVETKSIALLTELDFAQTLTYVRFLGLRFGLLLNFNTIKLKDGIRRVVNGYG